MGPFRPGRLGHPQAPAADGSGRHANQLHHRPQHALRRSAGCGVPHARPEGHQTHRVRGRRRASDHVEDGKGWWGGTSGHKGGEHRTTTARRRGPRCPQRSAERVPDPQQPFLRPSWPDN
ncbi:hypothetical protein [Ornithinimicrobium kibberense]|uniref:hypothetical protein n=1 Tax=Ornithinimicrobium kibberense TaxID=282060 RepID=UPI00360BBD4E